MGRAREERRARREAVRAAVVENPAAAVSAADLRLLRRPDLLARARALGVRGYSLMTKVQLEAATAAAAAAAAPPTGPPYRGWTPVLEIYSTKVEPNVYRVADGGLDRLYAAAADDICVDPKEVNRALVICCYETAVNDVWSELLEAAAAGPNAVCVEHNTPYTPEDFSRGAVVVMGE
jgi:hypothetical protein